MCWWKCWWKCWTISEKGPESFQEVPFTPQIYEHPLRIQHFPGSPLKSHSPVRVQLLSVYVVLVRSIKKQGVLKMCWWKCWWK